MTDKRSFLNLGFLPGPDYTGPGLLESVTRQPYTSVDQLDQNALNAAWPIAEKTSSYGFEDDPDAFGRALVAAYDALEGVEDAHPALYRLAARFALDDVLWDVDPEDTHPLRQALVEEVRFMREWGPSDRAAFAQAIERRAQRR